MELGDSGKPGCSTKCPCRGPLEQEFLAADPQIPFQIAQNRVPTLLREPQLGSDLACLPVF